MFWISFYFIKIYKNYQKNLNSFFYFNLVIILFVLQLISVSLGLTF